MRLYITPGDGTPIYRQIMTQLKYLISSGRLKPGDELPPIRTLAQQLVINPNTVARAYRELETLGLLVSRQGSGTRVADGGSPLAEREKERILADRVDAMLAEAVHLGFRLDEVLQRVRAQYKTMRSGEAAE